jgi:hypothetical protein
MAKGVAFALIGFLIVLVGAGAYLAGKKGVSIKISTPTPSPSAALSTPTPTPEDEIPAIKKAILTKLNTDETQVTVSVNTVKGSLAKGTVGGTGGGGYFLAAKTAQGWIIVYDGQSNPPCSDIAPYNFPTDMVPECMDVNYNVVTR